ncbi:hypothetical protein GF345_02460 [Candidatus Woesearchaeota archaeon]|nr:hypothetical protein [Candidatus Woesearchaeota archaeon]
MESNTLKTLALFMSCLIISIPFYISGVHAQGMGESITILSRSGQDDIEGFMGVDDNAKITVNARLSSELTDSQSIHAYLPLFAAPGYFSSCDPIPGASGYQYECYFESSDSPPMPGVYPSKVCLSGPGWCRPDCSSCADIPTPYLKTFDMYVDGEAPDVNSFDVNPKNTNGVSLTASYIVEDTLCAASVCRNKCAGLDKIEIIDLSSDAVLAEEDISTQPDDCRKSGTLEFSMSSVSNGVTSVCLKAYDALGHSTYASDNCVDVNKDDNAPVITIADIFDSNGRAPLRYVKEGGSNSMVLVNITSSDLFGIDSAKADLTDFGLGKRTLECTGDTGLFTCTDSFNLQLSDETTGTLSVEVNDSGGNSVSDTKSITIGLDTVAPKVDYLLTDHNYNATGYAGPGLNTVIAVINDTGGVGMGGSHATISIDSGSPEDATCTAAGDLWLCAIYNVTANDDLSVLVTASDDAGNEMSPYSGTIEYDDTPPLLNNVTLFNLADSTRFVFFTGDDMLVRASLTDDSSVMDDAGVFNVSGKFTGFASSAFKQAEDCYPKNESWICEWNLIDVLDGDVTASFNISDIVGNMNKSTNANPITDFYVGIINAQGEEEIMPWPPAPVSVYPQDTNETIDYWENELIAAYPSFVDSETTRVIGHDIWFRLKLNAKDPDNTNLLFSSFDPATCGADFDSYADSTGTFLVNPTPNSTEPWIKVAINKGIIEKSQLKFNCTMTLISLRNGNASMPEIENITLIVPVTQVEELGDSVEDEIDAVENGALIRIGDWIDSVAKVLDILDTLCSIIYAMNGLAGALHTAFAVTAPLEGTPWDGIARAFNQLSRWSGDFLEKSGWKKLMTYCGLLSCNFRECNPDADDPGSEKWYCKPYNAIIGNSAVAIVDWMPSLSQSMGSLASKDFISTIYPEELLKAREGATDLTEEQKKTAAIDAIHGNVKSSFLLSVVSLCVPGIIYNLKKARDIECNYLLCLKQQVAAGVPVYACTQMRSYQWCLFFWGEVFNIFPFAGLIKGMMSQFAGMFTDPGVLLGFMTTYLCNNGPQEVQAACRLSELAQSIQQILDIYQSIAENESLFDFSESTICQEALDA